ncbi:CLUMA_CG002179, isoform A, partial [Clunio marinus]
YNIITSKIREHDFGKIVMFKNFLMDFSLSFVVAVFFYLIVEEPFCLIGKYVANYIVGLKCESIGKLIGKLCSSHMKTKSSTIDKTLTPHKTDDNKV